MSEKRDWEVSVWVRRVSDRTGKSNPRNWHEFVVPVALTDLTRRNFLTLCVAVRHAAWVFFQLELEHAYRGSYLRLHPFPFFSSGFFKLSFSSSSSSGSPFSYFSHFVYFHYMRRLHNGHNSYRRGVEMNSVYCIDSYFLVAICRTSDRLYTEFRFEFHEIPNRKQFFHRYLLSVFICFIFFCHF